MFFIKIIDNTQKPFTASIVNILSGGLFLSENKIYQMLTIGTVENGQRAIDTIRVLCLMRLGDWSEISAEGVETLLCAQLPKIFKANASFDIGDKVYCIVSDGFKHEDFDTTIHSGQPITIYDGHVFTKEVTSRVGNHADLPIYKEVFEVVEQVDDRSIYKIKNKHGHVMRIPGAVLCKQMEIIPYLE